MNDRELLELAAKAAEIEGKWERDTNFKQERWYFNVPYDTHNMLTGFEWNPLTDDALALRLAVKLGLRLEQDWFKPSGGYQPDQGRARVLTTYSLELTRTFEHRPAWFKEQFDNDPYAATRRAIVRAAAEIGKDMK